MVVVVATVCLGWSRAAVGCLAGALPEALVEEEWTPGGAEKMALVEWLEVHVSLVNIWVEYYTQ